MGCPPPAPRTGSCVDAAPHRRASASQKMQDGWPEFTIKAHSVVPASAAHTPRQTVSGRPGQRGSRPAPVPRGLQTAAGEPLNPAQVAPPGAAAAGWSGGAAFPRHAIPVRPSAPLPCTLQAAPLHPPTHTAALHGPEPEARRGLRTRLMQAARAAVPGELRQRPSSGATNREEPLTLRLWKRVCLPPTPSRAGQRVTAWGEQPNLPCHTPRPPEHADLGAPPAVPPRDA